MRLPLGPLRFFDHPFASISKARVVLAVTLVVVGGGLLWQWGHQMAAERYWRRARELEAPAERLAALERALSFNPHLGKARRQRAQELFSLGRYEDAEAEAKAAARGADSVALRRLQARIAEALGKRDEQIILLEDALRLRPGEPSALTRLAAAHYGAGRYEPAREIARRLYEREPNNPDAHYLLGACAQATDQPRLAAFYYAQLDDALDRGEAMTLTVHPAARRLYEEYGRPVNGPSDASSQTDEKKESPCSRERTEWTCFIPSDRVCRSSETAREGL